MAGAKCVVVGDSGSGKTTFIKQQRTGKFNPFYNYTMGVEICTFQKHEKFFTWHMWDIAGKDFIPRNREEYFRNADCALVFVDATRKEPFSNVQNWLSEIPPNIPVVICCNKVDTSEIVDEENFFFQDIHVVRMNLKESYNTNLPLEILTNLLLAD